MIEFNGIHKTYGAQEVLGGVSFRIDRGERIGVVGPNGSGKSTIFGMITGEVEPDKGTVSVRQGLRLGHIRQHLLPEDAAETLLDFASDAIPELAAILDEIHGVERSLAGGARHGGPHGGKTLAAADRDRLLRRLGELQHRYEAMGGYETRTRAARALGGLGFAARCFDRPLAELSGGWRMRAALARVIVSRPDILLLDEPSNYLDLPAVEWLCGFLREYEGTLLLISHDRFLLKALARRTLEVNAGEVTLYQGDYDYYRRERAARREQLEAAKASQDRKRAQVERFIERFRAKNTKASQVQSRVKALERIEEIVVPEEVRYTGEIRIPPPPRCGEEAARLEGAGVTYDGSTWVLRGVDLVVKSGAKTAFAGYNGTGKTTLLKAVAGVLPLSEGLRVLGHNVLVGYQAQELDEILPARRTAYDAVRDAAPAGVESRSLRSMLGAFGFSGESVDKPCGVLSGGERIRLAFARIFVNPPNLLILDEPTTHLDLAARETLQRALKEYAGTVCFVSHDVEFVRDVADAVVAMRPPGVKRYYGGYDYYRQKATEEEAATGAADGDGAETAAPQPETDPRKERRRQRAEARKDLAKVKKELERTIAGLESDLAALEVEKASIAGVFSDAARSSDYAVHSRRLKDVESETRKLITRWEAASLELEKLLVEYNEIHR